MAKAEAPRAEVTISLDCPDCAQPLHKNEKTDSIAEAYFVDCRVCGKKIFVERVIIVHKDEPNESTPVKKYED